jgi:membrane protein required for colicin V production
MSGAASFNVNTFDAVVLGVLAISGIVAFFRGFVRELLSLGAWVGAFIVTIYLFPHSTEFMKHHLHGSGGKSSQIAAGAGALGTYVAALFGFSIFNTIILRYLKTGAEVGILDNFMGLFFGLARGALIISLGYLILSGVIPKDKPPSWLKNSATKTYVEYGSDFLAKIAPKYLGDVEGFIKKEEQQAKEEMYGGSGWGSGGSGGSPDEPKSFNQILNQRYRPAAGSDGNN